MTNIEYRSQSGLWKLGQVALDHMKQNVPLLKIPVMRYKGVVIYRTLNEWMVCKTDHYHLTNETFIMIITRQKLKDIKSAIDIFTDDTIAENIKKVLSNHHSRTHLENCLHANETVMGQEYEPKATLLEIELEVTDEDAQ